MNELECRNDECGNVVCCDEGVCMCIVVCD